MIHSLRDDVIHYSFTFFHFILAVIHDSASTPDQVLSNVLDVFNLEFFLPSRVSKINNDNNNNNNKFYLSFPSVIYIYIIEYIALLSILNFSVEQMIAVFYHDI